ncbi:hypothetical protein D3C73_1287760 [compost metagenome]
MPATWITFISSETIIVCLVNPCVRMIVARALSSACRKIPPPTIFIYTLACTRISPVTFRAASRLPPNSSSTVLRIMPTARFSVMALPVTLAAS